MEVIFDPPPLRRRLQTQPNNDASAVSRGTSDLNVFANGLGYFAKSRGPQPGTDPSMRLSVYKLDFRISDSLPVKSRTHRYSLRAPEDVMTKHAWNRRFRPK
jgi:hypothetical protein